MEFVNKKKSLVCFEKITGLQYQTIILYEFLVKRKYSISHKKIPVFKKHENFVKKNPYRAWYLIKQADKYIGSTYILENNCLSVYLIPYKNHFLADVINLISKKHRPLKEIPSIRPSRYYINISPKNKNMLLQLKKIHAKKIQVSYSL